MEQAAEVSAVLLRFVRGGYDHATLHVNFS